MRLVKQSFEIVESVDGMEILRKIEAAGRTCYKSEAKITDSSAVEFVKRMLESGHHSVIEHHNITARVVTNRGVTHELVRHRLASYSQESTRYCNYGGGDVVFIRPVWWDSIDPIEQENFENFLAGTQDVYQYFIDSGWKPQQAREVLPNALKTEIVMTANLREWRHIFNLRCSKAAHPQIRELMLDGLHQFKNAIPVLFDDLVEKYL